MHFDYKIYAKFVVFLMSLSAYYMGIIHYSSYLCWLCILCRT